MEGRNGEQGQPNASSFPRAKEEQNPSRVRVKVNEAGTGLGSFHDGQLRGIVKILSRCPVA